MARHLVRHLVYRDNGIRILVTMLATHLSVAVHG
jgi:hypothetical protein